MVFEVRDLGPIAKGKVDLRPLTVFAGPSNTGKSWLATLIYVLNRHVRDCPYELSDFLEGLDGDSKDGAWPWSADIRGWMHDIETKGELIFTKQEIDALRKVLQDLSFNLESELQRCYGIADVAELIRHGSKGRVEIFSAKIAGITHHLFMSSRSRKISLKVDMPSELTLPINLLTHDRDFANHTSRYIRVICQALADLVHRNFGQAFYMPADRGGLMEVHAAVVGALIQNASRTGIRSKPRLPLLSGISSDFLNNLLEIARPRRPRSVSTRHMELAGKFEDGILGGAVQTEQSETGYPRFVYRPRGWNRSLSMMSVSSMVSELSPVALFLRHLKKGDTLILEEPEAHLHPAMQRRFTAEIVSWVKTGIRVVITTHSKWVLEELATIVARGESGIGIDAETGKPGLGANEVGVWLFDYVDRERASEGSKIEEVPWDRDKGGFEAGFYEVAMKGYDEWTRAIRHSLRESAEG